MSSTVIDTPKYNFLIIVWVFVDDMMMMMVIMKWLCKRNKKNVLYGPFGPILTILGAENCKTKK